jgi:hypothetical protein
MIIQAVDFASRGPLSIVQIGTSDQDAFRYISGAAASASGKLEILELEGGASVNEIAILNASEEFVFLMDADILAGAKQNRVVNASVLLAPHSKTRVPVSCVERGRWHFTSGKFRTSDFVAPSSLRSSKADKIRESLNQKAGHFADQGEIWARVDHMAAGHKVSSSTANLSDVYEAKMKDFDSFIGALKPGPSANGLAVFLGKDLMAVDLFHRRDIHAEYFPRLLRAAAFEAQLVRDQKTATAEAEAKYRSTEFLEGIEGADAEDFPGVGVGKEKRFSHQSLDGFQLVHGGHTIHLAAFRKAEGHGAQKGRRVQ